MFLQKSQETKMDREFEELPDSWTLIGDNLNASGSNNTEDLLGILPASVTDHDKNKEPINSQIDQEK
jgi:hypothetical protein